MLLFNRALSWKEDSYTLGGSMKIVIEKEEAIVLAKYVDTIIISNNIIAEEFDEKQSPVDTVERLEQWFNDKIDKKVVKQKIVVISITLTGKIKIEIVSEFIVDFMTLYCGLIAKVTPLVVNTIKGFVEIVESTTPDMEAFTTKWVK